VTFEYLTDQVFPVMYWSLQLGFHISFLDPCSAVGAGAAMRCSHCNGTQYCARSKKQELGWRRSQVNPRFGNLWSTSEKASSSTRDRFTWHIRVVQWGISTGTPVNADRTCLPMPLCMLTYPAKNWPVSDMQIWSCQHSPSFP
jgi:hypothetical protein